VAKRLLQVRGADDWPDERREMAYKEARSVIEAQNATMADIDDKAMRSVRLNAILLGLLVTGLQFAPTAFNTTALQGAFALCRPSAGSSPTTSRTCSWGRVHRGPRCRYVFGPPWEADLLETMAGMIAQNFDDVRRNARWLSAMQVTLVLGIIAAVAIYR